MTLFIRQHLRILAAVAAFLGAMLIALLLNRKGPPMIGPPDLKNELRAIKAEGEVEKVHAELGAEHARTFVQEQHAEKIKALDVQQQEEAKALENDPAKLAGWLVRIGAAK